MNKPNMYDLIQHLSLEKVVAIESVEQEACQEIADEDIIECNDDTYTIPPSREVSTIPCKGGTINLFERLTADLQLPTPPEKCSSCEEFVYFDEHLSYCATCHHPFYPGN